MRNITELVWHCTATPEGREVSVAEIDRWHKERGWTGIGYHKVVHLDGSISDGRPESQIGAHTQGRNTATLGYVYVGGMDARGRRAKDTRTPAQKTTMERLTREAIRKYRLKMISGHRDYAPKDCPCFNASAEYAMLIDAELGMPPKDPARLTRSRTVAGSLTAAAGGAAAIADGVSQLSSSAEKANGYFSGGSAFAWAVGALVLAGTLTALYARWDDAGRPLPWGKKP